jgi:membrane associated rhomboid family serine protease
VATTTFGKRGLTKPAVSRAIKPAAPTSTAPEDQDDSAVSRLPLLTLGLIVFLFLIFEVERRFAFDIGKNGELSLESLIALGGVSYDRVVSAHEWWRLFLGPLLHLSYGHVIGNCFALLFIGARLEGMIGRTWLAAIFAVSALSGDVGSLLGNAHSTTTVGASGAISGLIGALFVVSFQIADPVIQRKMMRTAVRFGVPALAPLIFGAAGHVDYFAHSAGAVGGGLVGMVMSGLWREDRHYPGLGREVAAATMIGLAATFVAAGFAASQFSSHAERAAQLIPSSESLGKDNPGKTAELAARYPNDPRGHFAKAIMLIKAHDWSGAESALRRTLDVALANASPQAFVDYTRTVLAAVLAEEGRRNEARQSVASICRDKDQVAANVRLVLQQAKLCD